MFVQFKMNVNLDDYNIHHPKLLWVHGMLFEIMLDSGINWYGFGQTKPYGHNNYKYIVINIL